MDEKHIWKIFEKFLKIFSENSKNDCLTIFGKFLLNIAPFWRYVTSDFYNNFSNFGGNPPFPLAKLMLMALEEKLIYGLLVPKRLNFYHTIRGCITSWCLNWNQPPCIYCQGGKGVTPFCVDFLETTRRAKGLTFRRKSCARKN